MVTTSDTHGLNPSKPTFQQNASGEVPSGFILKLFQMVEGAPDEVIAVSSVASLYPTSSIVFEKSSVRLVVMFGDDDALLGALRTDRSSEGHVARSPIAIRSLCGICSLT